MKVKRFVAFFLIFVISMCNNYNVLAAVSEYTNGPRCKKINVENYVESLDDLIINNPYDVNSFVDFSAKHSLINVQTSNFGKAIGNIYGGAWVKYDNFDFGKEGRKLDSLNFEVAHPEGYAGVVRVYLLNCRGERDITTSLGVYQGMLEGDIKLAEHRFEKTDVCGNGWTVPEELVITPDVEMVKGTYDILITFSSTGIGNYFNFWFSAEAIDEDNVTGEFIACDSDIKFSDADLYNWTSGYKPGSDFVHTTSRNKWLLYRNIDFGRDGINNFSFYFGKEGNYYGNIRVYAVNDEIADGLQKPVLDMGNLEDGELIAERYLSSADNTGAWDKTKEVVVELFDGEVVRGVKNILITFDNNGIGNFYNFSFKRKNPVELSNSGNILYDEFIPLIFDQVRIGVSCKEDTSLVVTLDDKKYNVVAKSDENYVTIALDNALLPDVYNLRIEPNGYININTIAFDKIKISTAQSAVFSDPDKTPYTDYTEMESLMRSAIILCKDSPVYVTSNAKRYINYNDISELPCVINDDFYIPVETFSVMTGAYYEENGDYCQIRVNNTEFYKKGSTLLRQDDCGSAYEVENDMIVKNQKHYIPVKKYLEIAGKVVFEKDGILLADNRARIRELSKPEVFSGILEIYNSMSEKTVNSKIYHVSQDGAASDDNDGSEEAPFVTLQKAAEVAKAGDTVIVHEGTYRETLAPINNGTEKNPIIFKPADGEKVTVSALEKVVDSYTMEGNMRVYELDNALPQGRNQVFVNNEALCEGRFPNSADNDMSEMFNRIDVSSLWPTTGNIRMVVNEDETTDINTFYCEDAKDLEDNYFADATFVSFHGYSWTQGTAKITSSENGYIHLGDRTTNWWYEGVTADDYGYITNCKNVVDMPGEWYVDDNNDKLYIIPSSENDEYEIKQRQLCIDLNDREYVQVIGINTIGGGTRMNNAKMCVLNGGEHKYISHYTYSADQHYGFIDDGNLFDENGAPLRGEVGMYISGRDNAVINTNIKYSAASALYLTGAYSLVSNNLIEEAGYMGAYVSGIFVMPAGGGECFRDVRGGHSIYFNTIDKTGRGCIEFSTNEDPTWFKQGVAPFVACDIAYNVLSNGSVTSDDTGNIYIHGVQIGDDEEKTKIRNNIIYDGRAQGDSVNAGIYFDNYAQMGQAYENVIFYTENGEAIKKTANIHVQSAKGFPGSFAMIDVWNNSLGDTAKQLPLKSFEFPNGKKFRAGANAECVNQYENDSIERSVSADDLTAINFEGKYNGLLIYYKINNYDTEDKLKVSVGNEISVVLLKNNATRRGTINSVIVPVNQYDNEKNISYEYIEKSGSEVVAFMPIEVEADEIYALVGKTYGGEFTEGDTLTKLGPDNEHYLAYETYRTKTLFYEDVNITKSVDTAVISYMSDATYSGGKVTMYADDEYICEFTINKSSWKDYSPVYLKMDKILEEGKHDIKVVFNGQGSQTCDFWWFAFENYDTFTKDIYSGEIELYNSQITKGVTHRHNGVVVTSKSQIVLDCADFGTLGYFKLTVDYDLLTEENLKFKVIVDGGEENLILNPEIVSGTTFYIPCQMLSKTSLEGIKNIKITFEGEGSALIKCMKFKRTPIYFENISYENGVVSGILNGSSGKAFISTYSASGKQKDIVVVNETDGSFGVPADVGDKVKAICLNSLDMLTPYCEDISYVLLHQ